MKAGRDIVGSGTALLEAIDGTGGGDMMFRNYSNLFVHNNAFDVSVVSAGRDILTSSFNVAGPGTLDISAGRNILMQDKGSVVSLGPVVAGDKRPGAGIAMQAGVGAAGLDYLRFVKPYLDPANVAQTGVPLADQAGKVVKSYDDRIGDLAQSSATASRARPPKRWPFTWRCPSRSSACLPARCISPN